MIVEFSTGNSYSFQPVQALPLQAAPIRSRYPGLDTENIFQISPGQSLLKSKAIYGANASGKSNLIKSLVAMLTIIRDCLKNEQVLEQQIRPFALRDDTLTQPSFFQIILVLDGTQYRYGFEATQYEIISEWLYAKPLDAVGQVRERKYFTREGMEVSVNEAHYKEGSRLLRMDPKTPPLYRDDTLFLAVVAAFNGPLTSQILAFFRQGITVVSGLHDAGLQQHAIQAMQTASFQEKVTTLLQAIDPTIQRLERVELDITAETAHSDISALLHQWQERGTKTGDIAVYRTQYGTDDRKRGEAPLLMSQQEAEGTKKLFALSPYIFSTLERGDLLVIDEFDARMHPNLTRKVVELFHSSETNPRNAQLIFVTHDSNLLDAKLLRRDQISFARKDNRGATELYSLAEFKGVRNDASFEKDYLLGRYDAVPVNLHLLEEAVETYVTRTHGAVQS
ncbi:MAG: ATP-binding protein [Bacteroidia bacterium]|nr:ATP-binding protein [Bacteroidia bacterium]